MKLFDLQEARYAFTGMKYEDFKQGDHIVMTHKLKNGIDKRAAVVTNVMPDEGMITFVPDHVLNKSYLSSGSGAFDPTRIGKKRFGLVDVEVVAGKDFRPKGYK